MGRVTLEVNGKAYVFGCEDGGEAHLQALVAQIDEKIRQVAPEAGPAGETRLMLMAALMITDDLDAERKKAAALEADIEALKKAMEEMEARVLTALDLAADRMEIMAPETSPGQMQLL